MRYALWTIALIAALALASLSCESDRDDDQDDDQDQPADDDADDDDFGPDLPMAEPLRWGQYVCGPSQKDDVTVRVVSLNLHGGKEATAERIAAALLTLEPDLLMLQECPESYAPIIAETLGMELFWFQDRALLSIAPLIDPAGIVLVYNDSLVHAATTVNGLTLSAYSVHVDWNHRGDEQCRQIVDEILAVDPAERIVLAGDWNDEFGSTQINSIDEVAADAWSSLGVWPSGRVSWPAQLFYGPEGSQLIDNAFFNKSSGACAEQGQIVNFTLPLSDHKPQLTVLRFPAEPRMRPPQLLDRLAGLGPDSVGLLFDRPLTEAQVELRHQGEAIPLRAIRLLGRGEIVQVQAEQDLPQDVELIARVTQAIDLDGVELSEPVELSVVNRIDLLSDGGAEQCGAGWDLNHMQTATGFFEVAPLVGARFFSGVLEHSRGWAYQEIELADYAGQIDAGRGRLVFSGACRTGYLMDGASNEIHAYDEAEALLEIFDAQWSLLSASSSGRLDTLYWQPWRVIAELPPGARYCRVTLRAVGGLYGAQFNAAAFDAMQLAFETAPQPHQRLSGNLLAEPEFDQDLESWTTQGALLAGRDHFLHGNFNVYSFSGERWLGAPLLLGSASAEQQLDLAAYADQIDQGGLALRWGGAMRSLLGDAAGTISLSVLDQQGRELSAAQIGPIRLAEYFLYQQITPLAPGARQARWRWQSELNELPIDAAFLDEPFIYLVR